MASPSVLAARAVRAASRASGRGGGTTLPGRVLLRLQPDAIERLGRSLEEGSVIVSATNGKTTTASMLSAILARAGRDVVHNRAGSNMHWGVATALLDAGRRPGERSGSSRSTRHGWRRWRGGCTRACSCSGTSSATSSTATASSRPSPTPGPSSCRSSRRARASRERRRPAGGRPRPRP